MKKFAELLHRLYFTYGHKEKNALLQEYFATTPDPDRGYAIAIIAGVLDFKYFKRNILYKLLAENIDEVLFNLSHDFVGDFAETIALLWPSNNATDKNFTLTEIVQTLQKQEKSTISQTVYTLLDSLTPNERWVLVKMAVGELRIGVSARFLKKALADYGNKNVQDIEEVWHALQPPYHDLFAWLENKSEKPDVKDNIYFHPVMLSHPLEENDLEKIKLEEYIAEWKYDGIRVQIVSTKNGIALYSRTGDNIGKAFPDLLEKINFHAVLDGELVVKKGEVIKSFNDLQQRLNRKKADCKMIEAYPAHIILYDALFIDDADIRSISFIERRKKLEEWYQKHASAAFSLSPIINFKLPKDLKHLREAEDLYPNPSVEGLMLKRKSSPYLPGRPTGHWYKWKRDPYTLDAVMMYAQRGNGQRSSFYSDYTFGLWQEDTLLPIGKAYFGFTDEELRELDKWIRRHTLQKFGPVREVEKKLVLEIAFDAIQLSNRHKSGFALRFPRISRIRWDKLAQDADHMHALRFLYEGQKSNKG